MAKLPAIYIYLDAEGIGSLFAQTVDELVIEKSKASESEAGTKLSGRFGLGSLITKLLGDAAIEGEGALSKKRSEAIKSTLTVEHKLANLISYLSTEGIGQAFSDLYAAVQKAKATGEHVFVCGTQKFNMPQFMKGQLGIDSANTS